MKNETKCQSSPLVIIYAPKHTILVHEEFFFIANLHKRCDAAVHPLAICIIFFRMIGRKLERKA